MQVIMKRLILLPMLFYVAMAFSAEGVNVVYPGWFKDSFYDLQSDLNDARDSGKTGIMVFFSTKTCSYCKAIIETTFQQADIVSQLRNEYDVIGLEILSDTEVVDMNGKSLWAKDFAVQSKAQFTPTMIFYDVDGNQQLRLIGYQSADKFRGVLNYLKGKHYTKMKLRDYLQQSKSIAKSTPQKNTRLDLRPVADKTLLVIMESDACTKCQQLRAMLKAPVLQQYIEKMNITYISSSDATTSFTTPGGKKQNGKSWANQLGLIYSPTMLFFNEKGKEVLRVDTDILIDQYGKSIATDDVNILANIRARLQYVLEKGYITQPQFQRWRAQQSKI